MTDSCCDWEEAPLVRETFLLKARVVRRAFREMGLQDNDRFTAPRQNGGSTNSLADPAAAGRPAVTKSST